jgi:AcrR family transcriptional regulator
MTEFVKKAGFQEAEVYAFFPSFQAIEAEIALGLFNTVAQQLSNAPEYAAYGVREKVLAVFFTWTESLRESRTLVTILTDIQGYTWQENMQSAFERLICAILAEGVGTREVADRLLLSNWNPDVLWWQFVGVTAFWVGDTSAEFEQTDALIEKAVNFWIDLMQPNFLDSAFDLLRWAFNQR